MARVERNSSSFSWAWLVGARPGRRCWKTGRTRAGSDWMFLEPSKTRSFFWLEIRLPSSTGDDGERDFYGSWSLNH
jgi:hypothetical protein